jgi:hypothetical protein
MKTSTVAQNSSKVLGLSRAKYQLTKSRYWCPATQKHHENGCITTVVSVSRPSHTRPLVRKSTYVAAAIKISAVLASLKHEIPASRKSMARKVHNTRSRLLEIVCMIKIGTGRMATRIKAIKVRVAKCNMDSENI